MTKQLTSLLDCIMNSYHDYAMPTQSGIFLFSITAENTFKFVKPFSSLIPARQISMISFFSATSSICAVHAMHLLNKDKWWVANGE